MASDINQEEGKSGGGGLVVVVILIVVLGGFVALVKLDVFGLGSNVLGPAIQDVPVLNLILPEMPEDMTDTSDTAVQVNYSFETIEDAIAELKIRDQQLKELLDQAEIDSEAYTALLLENERLKEFEANQTQFEADKAEFDLLVAEQADPQDYMDFVESTFEESALAIYETLVTEKVYSEEVTANAAMYASMKPEDAAAIMEITHLSDIDMVSEILMSLEASKAGAILAEMDPTTADRISRYMYPQED